MPIGRAEWEKAFQIYSTLTIPQKCQVTDVIKKPFNDLCQKTAEFHPPFEYLRERVDLLDPSLRVTVVLARQGEDIAQRWLNLFFSNIMGPRGRKPARLTHEETMWLYHTTQRMQQSLEPKDGLTAPVSRWSPTNIARDEFTKRFAKVGFQRHGKKLFCQRSWGCLLLASDYGPVKRALKLFYETEGIVVHFSFGRLFMFSSGDISTKNEKQFRQVLAVQLNETLVLFPHVIKAIDAGVLMGTEYLLATYGG